MKRIKVISIIILLLIIGCSKTERIFINERIFTFQNLNLKYVIELEEKLNSEDISPDYRIGLGKGIYPNVNNYKLEISRNYRRLIEPNFSLEVDYHFTRDSLIRVVMYEWNEVNKKNSSDLNNEKANIQTKKIFEKKFSDLKERLNKEFGKPSFVEMGSDKPKQKGTYRNGIKWLNKNGMNCYLFAFGNKGGTYNQIRLAIYPD